MNLIVEIFRETRVRSMLVRVASCSYKLLELDSSNEVLILGSHETVVFREQEDLVVSFCTLSIFHQEGSSLLFRQVCKLLWVSDNVT